MLLQKLGIHESLDYEYEDEDEDWRSSGYGF
jgi:hypothetical protein